MKKLIIRNQLTSYSSLAILNVIELVKLERWYRSTGKRGGEVKAEECTWRLERAKVRYVSTELAAGRKKSRGAHTQQVIDNEQGIVGDTWAECLSLIVPTHCGLA